MVYGIAARTVKLDRKIDFLIVGAQKAGTTALFHYLGQHPDIFVPPVKEIHYFTNDEFYTQGEGYLRPFYEDRDSESVIGGAYVHLLYFPRSADRIHRYNPRMKIITVLRNPIDRAYSAYWFARRTGWEDASTFEEALAREQERVRGSYKEQAELTYLTHGHYSEQLGRFIDTFGRDQILVILSEELKNDRERTLTRALEWLGVTPDLSEIDFDEALNVAGMPRFPIVQKILRSGNSWPKRAFRRLTSARTRYFLRRYVKRPLLSKNIQPFDYPPMNEETRHSLAKYFSPHNAELSQMIGKELSHWR